MYFQTETKREIAATAELFRERVRRGHTASPDEPTERPDVSKEVLQEWRTALPPDDDIAEYVAFDRWPRDESLPDWIATIESLTQYVFQEYEHPAELPLDDELPFRDIFWPIAAFARRQLLDTEIPAFVRRPAIEDLQRWLVTRLQSLGAQVLHVDFIRYIAEYDATVITEDRRSAASTDWYNAYIEAVLSGRLTRIVSEFAVFARRLVRLCEQWAAAGAEFIQRLDADWTPIRETFGINATAITGLTTALGDHHNGGRSILTVQFDTGAEIVYKPRSISTQATLQAFIEWCAQTCEEVPDLARCELLNRGDYGWVEKVESHRLPAADIAEYYYRAGALLMILYLLHGTDYHFENIIADSQSPLVIDNETILHRELPLQGLPQEQLGGRVLESIIRESVLKTLLLPFWRMHLETTRTVEAGLGFVAPEATTEQLVWTDPNTDAMDIAYEQGRSVPDNNAPRTADGISPPSEFVSAITAGFEVTYQALLSHRDELLSKITELFTGCESRNLIQSTSTYQAALNTLTTPTNLRDGIIHDATMTRYEQKAIEMTSIGSVSVANPAKWVVRDAEYRALLAGDIPRFTTKSDEPHLYFDGDRVLDDAFEQTGMEAVRRRIRQLSDDDMRRQQSLIRACLVDRSVMEQTE
jgi:type 2 lantibiotic biosynthesis protein LanM